MIDPTLEAGIVASAMALASLLLSGMSLLAGAALAAWVGTPEDAGFDAVAASLSRVWRRRRSPVAPLVAQVFLLMVVVAVLTSRSWLVSSFFIRLADVLLGLPSWFLVNSVVTSFLFVFGVSVQIAGSFLLAWQGYTIVRRTALRPRRRAGAFP